MGDDPGPGLARRGRLARTDVGLSPRPRRYDEPRGTPVPPLVMDRPVLHPSSASSPTASASARSLEALPDAAPASPSRRCRSAGGAPRASSAAAARRALARGRRRARRRRGRRAGSSATTASRCCRAAASAGAPGLEPPPHLVGERARALDVLAARRARLRLGAGARRGHAAARRAAGAAPPRSRATSPGSTRSPSTSRSPATSGSTGSRSAASSRCAAGIVDVFPTTGREPLRIELFGDEIESIRAFSPFTQRALHPVDAATIYPAAERRLDLVEPRLADDEGAAPRRPGRPRRRSIAAGPDLVWQPDEVRAVWEEEELEPVAARAARPSSTRSRGPALRLRGAAPRDRGARPRRGRERARGARARRAARVVVAFPHRGEALRTQNLLRRVEARVLEPGEELPDEAELLFAVAPARRGFVWRELGLVLLPDTQVFRKRPPRAEPRRSAARSQSFADLRTGDYVVHEDHGVGKLLGFETKEVAGVTRDYLLLAFRGDDRLYVPHEQIGKVSRYIGADAKAPALSKLGGKAWQLLKTRARERSASSPASCSRSTRSARTRPGVAYDLDERVARAARGGVPVPRDARTSARRSRPSRRTSRRRARWTASSAATSASARPRSRCAPPSRSPSTASRR